MTEQPVLFQLGPPQPLPQPSTARRGRGPVSYKPHRARTRWPCEDCTLVAYEAAMDQRLNAPPIRQSTQIRSQGGAKLYLCGEHAEQHKYEERK